MPSFGIAWPAGEMVAERCSIDWIDIRDRPRGLQALHEPMVAGLNEERRHT
jgi:hypothetical protein